MEEKSLSQFDAQSRVDQIQSFQREFVELTNNGTINVPQEQSDNISSYHTLLLKKLSATYDVDINKQSKQLTIGMKIASLFGALAMAISIFFLFYQFWGHIGTTTQVSILIAAPVSLFLLSLHLAKTEKNAYFSKIAALVSFSCFVLNLSMLGAIFNITPSPNALVIWGAFSFILAYACNARLMLFFGIVSICCFIAMKVGTWSGMYWISFGQRPENFFIPGFIIFMLPQFINHRRYTGFDVIYRVMAMIIVFMPILILSNWGGISYLTWAADIIEGSYQFIGFVLSVIAIWLGIKLHWSHVTQTGNVFFILFLYTKFFDWWWEWMPKYIFFFILGLSALLALIVFKRLRLTNLNEGNA